jgi:CRISPR/Cas system CSM-associated protein Csm2 small subunit
MLELAKQHNINLSTVDDIVLRAAGRLKIGEELQSGKPLAEIVTQLRMVYDRIRKDLGISRKEDANEMEYLTMRFAEMTVKYHQDLSVSEVKTAFEMLMVGELDEFLRDHDGKVRKEHYQSLSVDYATRVFKAYKQRRDKSTIKIRKLLPGVDTMKVVTDEDKRREFKGFCAILERVIGRMAKGEFNPSEMTPYIFETLCDCNVITAEEPTQEDIANAYATILADQSVSGFLKDETKNLHARGELSPRLKMEAHSKMRSRILRTLEGFDTELVPEIIKRYETKYLQEKGL